jgi:hypothetical protein
MPGGDLLNLLIERDVFEEDFTRFYVAEVTHLVCFTSAWSLTRRFHEQMILAVEQCHKQGFIHRDIKPDVRHSHPPFKIHMINDFLGFLVSRTSSLPQMAISNSVILGWRK